MKIKNPDIQQIDSPDRRNFFKKAWKILGLIAAAEFSFLTINMFKNGKESSDKNLNASLKVIGNVEDFPVNSVTTDRVNKLYLIRENDGAFLALSLICSHLGCTVVWNEIDKKFVCPCHSSMFDKHGDVLNSPAPRPLDYYPVIVEGGKVKIDFNQKTKRKKFENNQLTYVI
ncbi:MAG: Rieske (2Fe-2S) protein [Bacteroidales bacterium]